MFNHLKISFAWMDDFLIRQVSFFGVLTDGLSKRLS